MNGIYENKEGNEPARAIPKENNSSKPSMSETLSLVIAVEQ